MTDYLFCIYCTEMLDRHNFETFHYSNEEKVNLNISIQYYENKDTEHSLRDSCNIYNKNSEFVKISWPDQIMINSQTAITNLFITSTTTLLTADEDDSNNSKPLQMIDMSVNVVCDRMSCHRVWLRVNRHNKKDFSINEMMQITNKDMKNISQTLINSFWWLNSKEEGQLITDKKEHECEWMIQYLSEICKFTITAQFLLLNLSSAVTENTSEAPSVKSEKNVSILRVSCSIVHNRQSHKQWKSIKKSLKRVTKYQVLTEHIVYLVIRDTDFWITDESEDLSWDIQVTCKYHILNVTESLITETMILWQIDFQTKDMHTAHAVQMCNNHHSWLYQAYDKWWSDWVAYIEIRMTWEWNLVQREWNTSLWRVKFSDNANIININACKSDSMNYWAWAVQIFEKNEHKLMNLFMI